MKGHPERFIDLEEALSEKELDKIDKDELKSIHSDILRVKSDLYEILNNKTNRALQLFRHSLLIVGALIAGFSFLVQGDIIQISTISNSEEILISFSLLFSSLLFSSLAYIPIPWKKGDFKSIYEAGDEDLSESKEKLRNRVNEEKKTIDDMRDVINLKNNALSIAVLGLIISLASLFISIRNYLTIYQQILLIGPFISIGLIFLYYNRDF